MVIEQYKSLFEYRGKPAGPELGKKIYAEAKKRKIKVVSRQVNTKNYKGVILTYPISFLNSIFQYEVKITSVTASDISDDKSQKISLNNLY